ncbi:MAG: ferritin-like domain-containing protein [Candidatus Sulfotelmatobacter sp.]
MSSEELGSAIVSSETSQPSAENNLSPRRNVNRRSFLKGSAVAGAATVGAGILASRLPALASSQKSSSSSLSSGDIAILQFLAAAELIEADMWVQYAELGGVNASNPYQVAFTNLDGDGQQYISSNTLDEITHAKFINAYLQSKGAPVVNFDQFRTLPSSKATGARQIGRLTNLMNVTVDTSWYTRYRSHKNPDFGATFPQAIVLSGLPAIPRTNADFGPTNHVQAIANTAAFHFGTIEQGGSSLYSAMVQKASDVEVLRIVVSIGGDEVAHFLEWVDFAGNGVQTPLAPFTDPTNGLTFPDFNATGNKLLQTNLIFPIPCEFIDASLPNVAVIRPTDPDGIAAGAVKAFTDMGIFVGQSTKFFDTFSALAAAADAAVRSF